MHPRLLPLALALLLTPLALHAQTSTTPVRYGVGRWNPDSLGNHRAVVRVATSAKPADAVRAHLAWRRRDRHPELKRIVVTTEAGARVANAVARRVTREAGDLVFQPAAGAGTYYVYYLPYQGTVKSNYPKITYLPPDSTADAAWLERHPAARDARLPRAELVEIQAADSMDRMDPMEVIATAAETAALRARHPGAAFLLFPEDRTRAIRMPDDLPQRWIATGANGPVTGTAQRGEFYAFQLGLWAQRPLDSVRVRFGELRGPNGAVIPASAFSSFTTGGVNWQGRAFTRRLRVDSNAVQPLWMGVLVSDSAAPGAYEGTVSVAAAGVAPVTLPVRLTVAPSIIANHGDDEPWRLSRLRWLDSRFRLDTTLVPPYTPVTVRGPARTPTLGVLGREIALAPTGLPARIGSFFTPAMTALGKRARPVLAAPIAFVAEDSSGRTLAWRGEGVRVTRTLPGAALWEATSRAGDLAMHARAQLDFDGNVEYTIAVTAARPVALADIRLELPFRRDAARYLMGMNHKGGTAPARYDWTWDVKRNQDAAWVGDVNAGLQFTLKDERYVRPLNTNFYQLRPLVMPRSWANGGKGGCRFRDEGKVYRATCYSGARTLQPGDTLFYDLRLLVTPFHPLEPRTHFTERYYHKYAPIDTIRAAGANVVNVHHATPVNPFINYPFLRPAAMKAYADSAHAAGMRMKIYYTVRELTNRAPELWALRSFGDEVLASGPGGGHSWLQEHVVHDYIPGWVVPELRDVALVTSGISRWHNFYVEGLQWLVDHVGIDGLYLDDVAFDRTTMQRIRRVLASRGTPGERIDLHSANQFNPNDGFASSANLYLEHFPYIDRLWFGEYFDYDAPPDYWLVELSGIPFGLMGEMLQDGGNPWRGMLFGMTNRLPWAGDPRPIWRAWDAFGIADATMLGWWAPRTPVRTERRDVLATTYLKRGEKALIALASWAPDTVSARLTIDWKALGLDPKRARLHAPAIDGFQPEATFAPGDVIPVAPKRGWLLVVERK
ncbi:MAG TPA: glycoside hydrolase domain-containing protein [Gemmatimonadales bacterium]|nr:glycoside hydrolase domain-containing protein [Gemmatimonadales bacterium]